MSSKGYRRFKSRLDYFLTDKEFVNILVLNRELLKGEDTIFRQVDSAKHPLLSNRTNNANSRKLVVNHLRRTIYVAFIKDMYEEVTEYMRYILQEGAMNGADTDRLVGDHPVKMNANDILAMGTKKEIVQAIMRQIFQQLESQRSTIDLISQIEKKLDLSINEQLIKKALLFLEIRHILVHSDGKPDEAFLKRYPTIEVDKQKKIVLNAAFIAEAYDAVNNLLLAIDKAMEAKNYFSDAELQSSKKE